MVIIRYERYQTMNTERRSDQRKTYLNKIRKSGKTSTAPLVYYKGTSFDRIIFEWIRDLEKATDAIKKALEIASKMTEEDWSQDNNHYAATCKWIQTGLDSIQQWDSESGKSATAITSLPWKNLRAFRNNLTHAFQDTPPDEVKQVADETLPTLKLLLNLINIRRQPLKRGETDYISVPGIEYLKRHLEPLTIREGTQLGHVGTALIYVGYDERYYPRYIHLTGYQEDGIIWTATPFNDQDTQPESFVIPIKSKESKIWTPPRRQNQ